MAAQCDYVLFSPLFDSVSKSGYRGAIDPAEVCQLLRRYHDGNMIALGGITLQNISLARAAAFDGVAAIGSIWKLDSTGAIDVSRTRLAYQRLTRRWQAAGGTLPLYIEVGGDSREVHGLFGVSNTTMVNTGAGATKAPVMYRVDGTGAVNIKVEGQNAEVYTLKAEIGKAPQKIRVETRYEWTAERQDINDKYPGFADWVADPTANWY